jgi:hypothetical protein
MYKNLWRTNKVKNLLRWPYLAQVRHILVLDDVLVLARHIQG